MKTKASRTNCFFSAICTLLIVAGLFLTPAMAQDNASAKILYLTGLNDNAVITLTNSEDAEDLATVKAYNANGLPVGTVFRTLSPGQTETIESQELPAGIRSVIIEFNGNLSCSAIVSGQNIAAIEKPLTQFDFPAENTSAVVIFNPNDSQADVSIIALDKDGIEIERISISGLYPMESREVVVNSVFESTTMSSISSVKVVSTSSIVATISGVGGSNSLKRSKRSNSSISLVHPVSKVRIAQKYGVNTWCKSGEYYHAGVDYGYNGSFDIFAAADGKVYRIPSESNFNHNLGNVVILEHSTSNGKIYTLYAHLAAIYVSPNQTVYQGKTVIGKMGSTGGNWHLHLHFELKSSGVLENPTGKPCGTSTCASGSGNPCYGYTKGHPDNFGFTDPAKYIGQIPTSQTGSVSGKLHETTANGPALSGATVTCGGKSTTTDSKGAFSISGISTGWQNLKFSKTGYQSYEKGVNIVAGQTANAGDVYLVCTACRQDQAAFAGENYPDNTSITGGTSFTKEWKIKNTGGTTWTSAYKLRLYKFTGGRLSNVSEKAVSGTVSPNSIYSFQVSMKAPAAQTSDKTYREEWNLVGPSGIIPVSGSQIVWVQIKVSGGGTGGGDDKAAFVSENYPDNTSVNGNSSFTKEWTLKNTGTTTWNSGYKLRYSSDSGTRFSPDFSQGSFSGL